MHTIIFFIFNWAFEIIQKFTLINWLHIKRKKRQNLRFHGNNDVHSSRTRSHGTSCLQKSPRHSSKSPTILWRHISSRDTRRNKSSQIINGIGIFRNNLSKTNWKLFVSLQLRTISILAVHPWAEWLAHWLHMQEILGSNPIPAKFFSWKSQDFVYKFFQNCSSNHQLTSRS